jgi:hypothetical protein
VDLNRFFFRQDVSGLKKIDFMHAIFGNKLSLVLPDFIVLEELSFNTVNLSSGLFLSFLMSVFFLVPNLKTLYIKDCPRLSKSDVEDVLSYIPLPPLDDHFELKFGEEKREASIDWASMPFM